MQYSINSEYPVDTLPNRIRLSDGSTRTDSSTFTTSELTSAGIVTTTNPPSYNSDTHKLTWDGSNWQTISLTSAELLEIINQKWINVRNERNDLLNFADKLVIRQQSQTRLGISTVHSISELDQYMQTLRNIPQNNADPDNINWPVLSVDS